MTKDELLERSPQESNVQAAQQLDRGSANVADARLELLEQPDALLRR
jgi:hypothetical protein